MSALVSLLLLVSCSVAELLPEADFEKGDGPPDEQRQLNGRKRKSSAAPRIVGGIPAGANAYPFIVSLYSLDEPDGTVPVCGK